MNSRSTRQDVAGEHERPSNALLQTTASDSARMPKGKPQLLFSTTVESFESSPAASCAESIFSLPPKACSVHPEALQQRRLIPGGSGIKTDPALTKSPHQDPSTSAPIFPGGNRAADLFPWTGSHPEDVLSEALVKGGISNKSQIMNETNTARPSLWANLKNKSGTSTLSTLFIAVLEKRQACSRLAAPNTFKPPPRLTLRDSTRETWLHDLANPVVGLRRLSRTIPHGITGKVLLEQCLNKNIPIPRALWLAKCVGINEMRAHKRKGQAGTITWIRGWTSSVEQFLDGAIAGIGQQDWKTRITYALQLAAHLYKEHLLEEDHFMDWILNSLRSASSERLFLWLLITCIPDFWVNLISSRRRGKRLAESLIIHAEKIYTLDQEVRKTSVLSLLESIITRISISKPACLLLPDDWERCSGVLRTFTQRRAHAKISLAIADVDDRNRNIMHGPKLGSKISQRSFRMLFRLLDDWNYQASMFVDDLALQCMDLFPDHARLVSGVLQWASSLYRQGLHRVYLVTRLLRKWHQAGTDVCEGIMIYLPTVAMDRSKEPEVIFRVIAELVRSKTFPLGRYLQWLIATGSMDSVNSFHTTSAWPLRLLAEIPLTGLSIQVLNLRGTMLRGTSYSIKTEKEQIHNTEERILSHLNNCSRAGPGGSGQMALDIKPLSRTVCLETAIWLRHQVAMTVEGFECASTKDDNVFTSNSICTISSGRFDVVRDYLEQFNDLSVLADVVAIAVTSYDSHVLAALADTICYHFKAFRVIGAFDPLCEKLLLRYTAIRALRLPERDLLLSLRALCQLAHVDSQITQLLDYDLSRYDQKIILAGCSPVSDAMIENNLQSDPEDEIERILSSGNNMDHQTMNRVFLKIVSYIDERVSQGSNLPENLSVWLSRLQSFEDRTFRSVLSSWLYTMLASSERFAFSSALPSLVVSGCLTLSLFLQTIQDCMRRLQPDHPTESFHVGIKGLDKILPNDALDGLEYRHAYKLRTQQVAFCQKQDSGLLDLIKEVFELSAVIPEFQSKHESFNILWSNRLLSVLKHFAVVDLQNVSFLLDISRRSLNSVFHTRIVSMLDRLIDPHNALNLSKIPLEQQATTIFRTADQLSLPFCQLKLRDLFNCIPPAGDSMRSLPAAFINFLKSCPDVDHAYLLDLVSGLDTTFSLLIRERAEDEILSFSTFLCEATQDDRLENIADEPSCIHRLLEVICATRVEGTGDAQLPLLVPLVERFRGITEVLHQMNDRPVAPSEARTINHGLWSSKLCSWLNILLKLVVYRTPALVLGASHQQQAALMWNLRNLFTHPYLEAFPSTTQYIFDVSVLLSDYISGDVLKSLSRLTCTGYCSKNTQCAFVFGSSCQNDGWLGLTKAFNQTAASHTTNSPTTGSAQTHMQQFGAGIALSQRSPSNQQAQTQQQGRSFAYPQHQPSHKVLSQPLQRLGSSGQTNQNSQIQQMQHMQAMAQQRQAAAVGGQLHRMPVGQTQPSMAKSSNARQEKIDAKPVPYMLNRWEILPENGGNAGGNETAIGLNLFGARKA